ncbi:hypothetical protein JR316_0003956 [Psilocybe cubensis]|uniref:Uncharacterized protein n=1 Tax=Psilocybe cubensis TaxID=181762 RepID=A0ACB8HB99_PSICU|nr:hypothetical protein JR316_0003956 [Psilocybe cubensis]KAH9484474.1 hypothetical protein JR316_0003956 [Psilocybe cubensis]
MTSGIQSLPFLGLNEDILLYIFSLNANAVDSFVCESHSYPVSVMDIDYGRSAALNVTRYSSQVCREWRHLILASPTLWANSLDLELLDCGTDEWRNEVVKRTGNCLLTVVGTMPSMYELFPMFQFLRDFFDKNWTRIRRLIVYDDFFNGANWKELLKRPSPNLERLRIMGQDMTFDNIQDGTLFSGTSPRPSKLLRGLKLLPYLETLGIVNNLIDYELDRPLAPINLPNLTQLSIKSNVMTIIPMLKYLVPGPNCSLRLDDYFYLPRTFSSLPETFENYLDIGGALSTFLGHQAYQNLTFHKFHYYEMKDRGKFNIRDDQGVFDIALEDTVTILLNHGENWPDFVSQVNAALSPLACSVLPTTNLHLGVHDLPSQSDSMLAFFDNFKNVRILETDPKTIQIIGQAVQTHRGGQLGGSTLFPSVCHIVVHPWQYKYKVDTKELYKFVKFRKNHAVPIEKVYFCYSSCTTEEAASWRAFANELDFEVEFESRANRSYDVSDSDAWP